MSPSISPQLTILSHLIDLTQEIAPSLNYRLEIQINLFKVSYYALLDSGASVSAISECLFKTFKNDPSKYEIPLVPLLGILLTRILSNKSVKINSQIYLTFKIKNNEYFGVFLIFP